MASRDATESQARTLRHGSHNIRTGLEADTIVTALIDNLHCLQARRPQDATRHDWYMALAYTVRDRMMHRYIRTVESISQTNMDAKVVAYHSAVLTRTAPWQWPYQSWNLGCRRGGVVARVGQELSNLLEHTEDVYKLYAESFRGSDHLRRIQKEAQAITSAALARLIVRRRLRLFLLPHSDGVDRAAITRASRTSAHV
jgi:hypothetical protein